MSESILKNKVVDHITIEIDPEDGTQSRKWKLCYNYRAIAAIEDAIGRDIKKITDWKDLSSGKHFPVIVWGGLRKFNPEVSLDEVLDVLNPTAQNTLSDLIFDLMFPGVKEAFEKLQRDKGAGATANPNSQTATE